MDHYTAPVLRIGVCVCVWAVANSESRRTGPGPAERAELDRYHPVVCCGSDSPFAGDPKAAWWGDDKLLARTSLDVGEARAHCYPLSLRVWEIQNKLRRRPALTISSWTAVWLPTAWTSLLSQAEELDQFPLLEQNNHSLLWFHLSTSLILCSLTFIFTQFLCLHLALILSLSLIRSLSFILSFCPFNSRPQKPSSCWSDKWQDWTPSLLMGPHRAAGKADKQPDTERQSKTDKER